MIIIQVTVIIVLSILSHANSQGTHQLQYYYTCLILCHVIGITLKLKGKSTKNDSYVSIDDIGKENGALLCLTDKRPCCVSTSTGEWYFPNGNQVPILRNVRHTNHYFYRNRDNQVVLLNRVMDPPERGRFFCEVPDSSGESQTIYVNIGKINVIIGLS